MLKSDCAGVHALVSSLHAQQRVRHGNPGCQIMNPVLLHAHSACPDAAPGVLQIASLLEAEYTLEERRQIGLATSEELAAILDAL